MEYGCSLAEIAKRLQLDRATALIAVQEGAIVIQKRNGRSIITSSAIAGYQARFRR